MKNYSQYEEIHPMKRALSKRSNRKRRTKSSWVNRYGYVVLGNGEEGLLVEFDDGNAITACFYAASDGYDEKIYLLMDAAPSKGSFVWEVLMPAAHGSNTNYIVL